MTFDYRHKLISPEAAAAKILSGDRVFLTGNCSTPQVFLRALLDRAPELEDVEIVQLLTFEPKDFMTPELAEHFRFNQMFIGPNMRGAVQAGLADFTPVPLSDMPRLFRLGKLPLDVSVIHVSPPDDHGFCSYGVEVGVTKTATECARLVIAEINPHVPRALGDSFIHISSIDYAIDVSYELPEILPEEPSDLQSQIARHISVLIPDGATLQLGIGGIPDAVLRQLTDHHDLGIHSELFSDGVMHMIEAGVITNARKNLHRGKVVAGMAIGTRALFRFIDDNPMFEMHPTEYVNDPFVIAQNDRMISINSAIEVDLTGQVCADSIGPKFYSGVGGQLDFVRGASHAREGKSFIALPSTARNDTLSRIVPQLKPGAGVVTPRAEVHYIVTEYGAVDLWGMTISQRVKALISIAHPDFREALTAYAREQHYLPQIYALG